MEKRTKIICTIGPASEKTAVISALVRNGMNNARLNFSHGTHANHKALIKNIRAAAAANKAVIGIIADLQGPKIRAGELGKEGIKLKTGETVVLTTGPASKKKISVTYPGMHRDVKPKHRLLLDDGLMEMRVILVRGRDIYCKVVNGGTLLSHKGINLPDSRVSLSSLTPKDKEDLKFAMSESVDFVAISFVRSAKDVRELLVLIEKNAKVLKCKKPRVIVKIEKGEALQNFVEILGLTDGVMIARGDLAVETPAEDVPLRQKEIVALCRQAAKPVIVATQMLDSMIRNPRPTRAEVSDVANAVMDHVDSTMLSGESASGKYPVQAVTTMAKIIKETEESPYDDTEVAGGKGKGEAIGNAVNILVRKTNIPAVVDLSSHGLYRYISKGRPEVDIFARIAHGDMYPNLFWGVKPFSFDGGDLGAVAYLKKRKFLKKKFIVVGHKNEIEVID
jgi:pyruvate kinase